MIKNLICPRCGEMDAIQLLLFETKFACNKCDNLFTIEEVKSIVQVWQPVLEWMDKAPRAEKEVNP